MTTAGIKSHALKKMVANVLFFNKFVANASSIQFLAENEYLESKDNFKFKDHFILSNGVEIPKKHYVVKKRKEFKIVFIGRYNIYHKGLDILLESIRRHVDWFRNNRVVVELYGSDSDNGFAFLTGYVAKNKLNDIVHIKGPVFGEDKERALLDADIFIHTSRLEGQPTSVIEAISYGIPVIATPGTNMADVVERNNLGFVADFDSEGVYECIKKAFLNKDSFLQTSKNAVLYTKDNYGWDEIIKKTVTVYENIKNG